jgi:hypothetical protein
MKEVTVIIPTHNMKKDLIDCLNSLIKQSYKDYEIVIVDDASTDGTYEFLKEAYPFVNVIRNKIKVGPEASRNIAIKIIKSKYIAFLDADTLVNEKWLEELIKAMETNKDEKVGMCSCKILKYRLPHTIDNIGHGLYYDFSPIHLGEGKPSEKFSNEMQEVFGICLAGALVKKEIFDIVGLFDEDYQGNFGDDEWTWRARLHGYRCIYVPTAIMYHKRRGSGILNKENIIRWERNRLLSLIKYYPPLMILFSFYYSLKRYLIALLKPYPHKLPWTQIILGVLQGWLQALKMIKPFLEKRKIYKANWDKEIEKWLIKKWPCKNEIEMLYL